VRSIELHDYPRTANVGGNTTCLPSAPSITTRARSIRGRIDCSGMVATSLTWLQDAQGLVKEHLKRRAEPRPEGISSLSLVK
jgi:hypothetical protein